jgi:phosphoglycerol transferase
VILTFVLRLWQADLTVPMCATGDSLCAQAWMKSVLDHGWFLHNRSLGAPWGSDLYDFPIADTVHFFVIWLLCFGLTSPGLLFNVYFLLQFPLIACTAFFVLRRLHASTGLAFVCSLLYAFLPYHLSRGLGHVFLAAYFFVPIQILLAVRLGQGLPLIGLTGRCQLVKRILLVSILCFFITGAGVYYAFFGCFVYLLTATFAAIQGRGWAGIGKAIAMCCVTAVSLVLHLSPQLLYLYTQGGNPEAVRRSPADAELLGLKVAHLLLPVSGHRDGLLSSVKSRYLEDGRLNNENTDAALGLIGSTAFVFLLIHLLRRRGPVEDTRRTALDTLAVANIGAVLLGTIGGFGVLFSLLVSSWIRAYNRISVFIAFIVLAAAALALDPLLRRLSRNAWMKSACGLGLAIVLAFGIWDQTTQHMVPDFGRLTLDHKADKAFFTKLEANLPPEAMIFQLPYIAYPEALAFGRCDSYDHFKPYLVTHSLRWSFGTFRGRPEDAFKHMIGSCRTEQMLRILVLLGYEGLLVDRFGYADDGKRFEQTLQGLLRRAPQESGDGRWSYFALTGFKAELASLVPPGHWQQACQDLLHPVMPIVGDGFLLEEGPPEASFRWCRTDADLRLFNPEGLVRMVELEFEADRLSAESVNLELSFPDGKRSFRIGYGRQRFHVRLAASPGSTLIQFHCDGEPIKNQSDTRQMVYRMWNVTVLPESVP